MHAAVAVYGMLAKNALSNCMLLVTNLAARLEEDALLLSSTAVTVTQ